MRRNGNVSYTAQLGSELSAQADEHKAMGMACLVSN